MNALCWRNDRLVSSLLRDTEQDAGDCDCDCTLYTHTRNRLPAGAGAFERIPTGDDAPDDDDDDDGVTRARTHARVVVAGFRRPGFGFVGRDEYIHVRASRLDRFDPRSRGAF